jgi:guanylate kinase
VFIAPPSAADLRRRLEGRGTDRPEAIERRLGEAERELDARGEFAHEVVNDDVDAASDRLVALVRGQLAE